MDYDRFLEDAFKWTPKGKNYIYAKQLLTELYETEYGIIDHKTEEHPFGLVLQMESEQFTDHYLFDAYLESYLYKDIYKCTGISFDAFLDRPRYEIEKIVKQVDLFKKKEADVKKGVMDDLSGLSKQ